MGGLLIQQGKFHESRGLFQNDWSGVLAMEDPLHKSLMLMNVLLNTVLLDDGPDGRKAARKVPQESHVGGDGNKDKNGIHPPHLLPSQDSFLVAATAPLPSNMMIVTADKHEDAQLAESFAKTIGESKFFGMMVSLVIHYIHHEEYQKALEILVRTRGMHVPASSHMLESIVIGCVFVGRLVESIVTTASVDATLTTTITFGAVADSDRVSSNGKKVQEELQNITETLSSWKREMMASLQAPINVYEPIARAMMTGLLQMISMLTERTTTTSTSSSSKQTSTAKNNNTFINYLSSRLPKLQPLLTDRPTFKAMYFSLMLQLYKLFTTTITVNTSPKDLKQCPSRIANNDDGDGKSKNRNRAKRVGDKEMLNWQGWQRECHVLLDQLGLEKIKTWVTMEFR
jgi:hypothetical protein